MAATPLLCPLDTIRTDDWREDSSHPSLEYEDAMKSTIARSLCLGIAALAVALVVLNATRADQPAEKRTRSEFMRQKLNFSKDALEGLALEQFATIEKSGKALKRLSEAAEWEVPTIPNFTDYVALTTEFQRHADDLVKQAKKKNIDGATLAFIKITTSCVQCHKFVRDIGK
ncbi:MAG: hypothetical protein ACHRXM_32710 [Isosphaerales bacterium]